MIKPDFFSLFGNYLNVVKAKLNDIFAAYCFVYGGIVLSVNFMLFKKRPYVADGIISPSAIFLLNILNLLSNNFMEVLFIAIEYLNNFLLFIIGLVFIRY